MTRSIQTVGVCGAAGTMGAGIVIVSARAGFRTIAFDKSAEALARASRNTAAFFDRSVQRGKMDIHARNATLALISSSSDIADLGPCDLVIEAVFEDISAKKGLLQQLDAICLEDTVIASNTSTLSITEIASGSKRPERVVGMHFCLPAQLMKLVEITPGILSDPAALDAAWKWTETAGQTPVLVQDKPGFILNALLVPFNNDAIRALEAGVASAEDIDRAIKVALGYKMGPLELIDLVGLDTQIRLCEAFYPITLDPRASAPPLLRRMVAAGLLGRKSGRGFFEYKSNAIFGAQL